MIESNYEVEIDRGDLELALKERGRDKIGAEAERCSGLRVDYGPSVRFFTR